MSGNTLALLCVMPKSVSVLAPVLVMVIVCTPLALPTAVAGNVVVPVTVTMGGPTGVTLFEMRQAVDAGAIVAQRSVPFDADETIATVLDRVTATYLALLDATLSSLLSGTAVSMTRYFTG